MSEDQLDLNVEHKRIAMTGSVLGIITLGSFILMGFGTWTFTNHLQLNEDMLARMDSKTSLVANMRIQQCHDIQVQAVKAIERQSDAHVAHALVMGERESFERYVTIVENRLLRQEKSRYTE
jgi:hypothetical protein